MIERIDNEIYNSHGYGIQAMLPTRQIWELAVKYPEVQT